MIPVTWTPEIHDLIETLCCRVRVLRLADASVCTDGNSRSALQRLIAAELLEGDVWSLPPSPIGSKQLGQWSPGEPKPDLVVLQSIIHNRWDQPAVPTPVVTATDQAARLFGSSAHGFPAANHRNHDLLLAAVYMHYRRTQPALAKQWLGEDAVPNAERGIKNPDAFLIDDQGRIIRVIESTGRYSLRQLEAFHQHCQESELPYELW